MHRAECVVGGVRLGGTSVVITYWSVCGWKDFVYIKYCVCNEQCIAMTLCSYLSCSHSGKR